MISYEIIWIYQRQEYFVAGYTSKKEALAEFRRGRPRVLQMVHGGALRLEEIVDLDMTG